ncbi:MAG: DNA-processing protein DprA [Pseudomonadota bacterium]|nr:DNA-processing protein DprA [Pseudomonadota bacterium]
MPSASAASPIIVDTDPELALWLKLQATPGVGIETALRLLREFGLPSAVFANAPSALHQAVGPRLARALLAPSSPSTATLITQTLAWCRQPGNFLLTLADPRYPRALLTIPDPPLLLYACGRIDLLQRPALAVVGSRNATAQGMADAERFSRALGDAGLTIISGLALGIDAAAHAGALPTPSGTVAVIGTGIDVIYPARHRALTQRIAVQGCIVSEYPLGTPPMASNFPRRNRLISGLARAVLVIEAAAQSGSLITARVAAEQGRDVLALPGSIHAPLSRGCHRLIKQGAKLVECAQDVLDEIGTVEPAPHIVDAATTPAEQPPPASAPSAAIAPELAELHAALGFAPVDGDALAQRTGLDAADLSAQLFALEMQGLLEVLPGGRYRRLD